MSHRYEVNSLGFSGSPKDEEENSDAQNIRTSIHTPSDSPSDQVLAEGQEKTKMPVVPTVGHGRTTSQSSRWRHSMAITRRITTEVKM